MKKEDFDAKWPPEKVKKMFDDLRDLNEGEPKRRIAREALEMQIKFLTEMTLNESAEYRASNKKIRQLIKMRAEVNARVIANKTVQAKGGKPIYPDVFALLGFPERLTEESLDDYYQRLALSGLLTDENIDLMVAALNLGQNYDYSLTATFKEVRAQALKIEKH